MKLVNLNKLDVVANLSCVVRFVYESRVGNQSADIQTLAQGWDVNHEGHTDEVQHDRSADEPR
jgi:hypothetical protein